MTIPTEGLACIHACAYGCGRQYDVIVTQVVDGSVMMLCLPDFVSFAANVARAMTEPEDAQVKEVVASTNLTDVMLVTAAAEAKFSRGHSDPSPDDDFDVDEVTEG
jgi:hypothetical protein